MSTCSYPCQILGKITGWWYDLIFDLVSDTPHTAFEGDLDLFLTFYDIVMKKFVKVSQKWRWCMNKIWKSNFLKIRVSNKFKIFQNMGEIFIPPDGRLGCKNDDSQWKFHQNWLNRSAILASQNFSLYTLIWQILRSRYSTST